MLITNTLVKEMANRVGADAVGIAPVERFSKAHPQFGPLDKLPICKSVIVVGCPFPIESISLSTIEYTAIRNVMVEKVNDVANKLAVEIKKLKYKTKVIAGLGGKWDNGRFRGHISLKHAAELAGLGIITNNYLLTNPTYGNLLWFGAVLTNAELEPDPMLKLNICGNCNACKTICPAKALDDPNLFVQKECYNICYKTMKGVLELKCFECRKICPYRFGIPHNM